MPTPQNNSSSLMASAAERCHSHQCEDAIGFSEAAAQLDPANATIHYYLGICYSGGCRQHSLVDLQVAHVHLDKALSLLGAAADPLERAKIMAALGNTYAASSHMPLKARLLAAIECHQQAARIFQSEGRSDDFAREKFNLGNAFSELPEESVLNKWQNAIENYENALQVRTREKNPDAYAGTLQNLGIACRELRTGDRVENIKRSILCYRRALQVRRRGSHPHGYAALQINLGNSFMSLAEVEKSKAVRHGLRALRHYDQVLALRTEEDQSGEYAMVLFNRGEALVSVALGRACSEVYLREACSCFEEAANYFQQLNNAELVRKSRQRLDTIAQYLDTLKPNTICDTGEPNNPGES